MVLCVGACFMIGCSEQDEFETASTKSVQLSLEVQKAALISTKSEALEGSYEAIVYCDEDLAIGDYVVATYNVDFYDAADSKVGEIVSTTIDWTVSISDDYDSTLSTLLQLDYPEDATKADFIITDFRVYDDTHSVVKFITPTSTSAYGDYVINPVSKVFEIDLYEKQYMLMEVLCFDEETLPLFGFAWSDFEVVSGDEVCMFFNCLGITSSTQHQVLAADVEAKFYDGSAWTSYWVGSNYAYTGENSDETPLSITPFCIPCPGNWASQGFQVLVTPMGSTEAITIPVTADQISAFLNGKPLDYVGEENDIYSETIDSTVVDDVVARYIHYTFEDCYKPKAYFSNIKSGQVSDIYALSWDVSPIDGTFAQTLLFTQEGKCHIASTPDESTLFVVNSVGSTWGTDLYVYDIYSLTKTQLTFEAPDRTETTYKFSQLVYVDNQLYGGCANNECLVEINVDLDKGTFTFGEDLIEPSASQEEITGGDLLSAYNDAGELNLFSVTRDDKGSLIQFYNLDGMNTDETLISLSNDMKLITGACMVEGFEGALTSTSQNGYTFKYWSNGIPTIVYESNDDSKGSGDMASAFNDCTVDELLKAFVPVP